MFKRFLQRVIGDLGGEKSKMTCPLDDRSEIISAYLSDGLPDADKLTFEEHFFGCPDCFHNLKIAADAVALIEREGHAAFVRSPHLLKNYGSGLFASLADWFKFPWRWPQLASAAMALIILIGLPLIYRHFSTDTPAPESVAANFEKSPAFESLMRQTYQSNLFVSEVYPDNEQSFEGAIEFRWQLQEDYAVKAGKIELQIMNNKEQQLHTYQTTDNRFVFDEKLAPGLYYWALLSEKEMIYLGRFYVGKR